jgi:hypothetical protein
MIRHLLDRASRVREREGKGELDGTEAKDERKRIERLKKGYECAIGRIDAFYEACKEEEKKEQVNLIDPDSKIMEKDHRSHIRDFNSLIFCYLLQNYLTYV